MADQILSGARVLVVEDEMLIMMQIEDMLADLGCTQITRAADIQQALTAIRSKPFDCATLDVNLGGTRSDSVAEALDRRDVPFAYSTGYTAKSRIDDDHRHPLLNKPFTTAQFTEVMTELLGSSPNRGATAAS